jgi:adenylosuccinate lyase
MQEEPTSLRIEDPGVRALFTESARFQSWLDVEAALAELTIIPAKMPDSSIHGILDRARSREVLRASVRPPPNR